MIRLSMIRGDTTDLAVTLTDSEGIALDLDDVSDMTFTAQLNYDDSADTATTIVKTLGDGIEIDGYPEAGICTITINPEDTSDFAQPYGTLGHRLLWHIRIVGDYEQDVRTVARGYLFVYHDVAVTSA